MNIFEFRRRWMLALSGLLLTAPAAAMNFNDGNWHVTVTTEITGMQVRPPPPYFYTRCFTKRSFQPHLAPPGAPCRASNLRTHKDVMTWTLSCSESVAQMSGHGRMVFSGNRVTGTVTTLSQYPAEMQVVQKISGKRVGPCEVQGDPIEGRPLRPPLRDYQETVPKS
jgi:hypothetical protein